MTQSTRRNEEPTVSTAIESDAPVAERVENGGMSHPTPWPTPPKMTVERRRRRFP